MTHGGRPRREQVRPDSPFGRALKEHIRRIEGLTQTDLAREAALPEKTLSQMVKGKRTSGTMLRRDLRAIITVLHRRGALVTREEADQLMTTLPAIKALDERDPDDADIIALFDAPAMESAQAIDATLLMRLVCLYLPFLRARTIDRQRMECRNQPENPYRWRFLHLQKPRFAQAERRSNICGNMQGRPWSR